MRIVPIVVLIATTAFGQSKIRQINEDCKNEIQAGINASGGKKDSFGGSVGTTLCSQNQKRRWGLEGTLAAVRVSDDQSGQRVTVQGHLIEAGNETYFSDKWFGALNVSHEADSANGLQSRLFVAPGVGATVSSSRASLKFETGVARTAENTLGAAPTAFAEGWAASKLQWKIGPNVRFLQTLSFFASMSDNDNYRSTSRTEFRFKVTERFALQTNLIVEFDRKPARGYDEASWRTATVFVYSPGAAP